MTNAKPIFLWDDQARLATLSASTTAVAAFCALANLADWRPFLYWKGTGSSEQWVKIYNPAGITADSLAIAGHDLHTQGASIKLEASDTDGSYVEKVPSFAPADDKAFYKSWASCTRNYWKLTIPAGYTLPPSIGILFLGAKMQMPGWANAPFNPNPLVIEAVDNRSQTGQHLETIEKYRYREIALSFKSIPAAWFDANIDVFERTHVPRAFFWVWDETNHSADVFLMKKKAKEAYNAPLTPNLRTWDITVEGVAE